MPIMVPWLITGVGVLLELLLLVRGLAARLLHKYFFFYLYCLSAMVGTLAGVIILLKSPSLYEGSYWVIQLLTLVTGYGILLEIMNHVLTPYPGAEKFARVSGVGAFAAILCIVLVSSSVMPHSPHGVMVEFERDLRCVQSLFMFVLLAVIFYYGIAVGRNMKGMILGYGLYIATSLISLAFRAYAGRPFARMWMGVQPLSLDVSMLVWLAALWSYYPNPAPERGIRLEEDYESLVSRVRSGIGNIRSYLGRSTHP